MLLEELQAKIHGKLTKEVRADTLSALRLLIRKKSFIEDLEIDDNFKVHLLKNQIIEIKDIIKIHNRSGIEGVKRSLQKYGYESLCKTVNAPKDSKDLTQYLIRMWIRRIIERCAYLQLEKSQKCVIRLILPKRYSQ